jgi:hypothetical protein
VVAASQVCFVVLLGVCVALKPGLVIKRNEGGVSNYGVHWKTVAPYSLAYAVDAALLARAARLLDRLAMSRLGRLLRILSVLLIVTLVTTYGYTSATALKDVHFTVGSILILFEGASAPWLWRLTRRGVAASAGVATTFAGLVLCVLATLDVWHVLFAGQVLVIAGYAPLLTGAVRGALSVATPERP